MSDVPMELSGGLDSYNFGCSQKICSKRIESGDTTDAWYPQLHSFSVGLEGSPDLAAAQIVADHIGTIHHEIKSLFKKV
jgi:asparagine synthase (glutamine-hydrolysing)